MTLAIVDEKYVQEFKSRIILITGMGFFADAYDLFVIGIVTALLTPLWNLSTLQVSILNATSLAAAFIGAIVFGVLADKWGRKKFYGLEVALLCIGAILSACSSSFLFLLLTRIIIGLGIGGDYSTSAVIAGEYASTNRRGALVLMVFAMQGLGLLVGPMFTAILCQYSVDPDIMWRVLVGAGAIPAGLVFYMRRRIQETPRFLLTQPVNDKTHLAITRFATRSILPNMPVFTRQKLWTKKWLRCLVGTSLTWFVFDIAFYGNSVSMMLVLKALHRNGNVLMEMLLTTALVFVFAIPGYLMSARYVDRIGRVKLQIFGFLMMGLIYLAMSRIPNVSQHLALFFVLFGASYFFVNFGPNATTFLISSEIFPANLRATAHGISAAIGKLGAFVGAISVPAILESYGLSTSFFVLSIISFLGVFLSLILPEMSKKSLEASELFAYSPISRQLALQMD